MGLMGLEPIEQVASSLHVSEILARHRFQANQKSFAEVFGQPPTRILSTSTIWARITKKVDPIADMQALADRLITDQYIQEIDSAPLIRDLLALRQKVWMERLNENR